MRPMDLGYKRNEEMEGWRAVVRGIAVLYTHGSPHGGEHWIRNRGLEAGFRAFGDSLVGREVVLLTSRSGGRSSLI
jgi:hypothetical protein